MKAIPSRLKIALLSAGISGIVLTAFGLVMWVIVRDSRMEAVDREIRTVAARHPGIFANRGNYDRLTSWLESSFGADHTNRIILQLRNAADQTVYISPHWPPELTAEIFESYRVVPPAASTDTNELAGEAPFSGRGGHRGMGFGGPPRPVVFTRSAQFITRRIHDSSWRIGVLGSDEATLALGLNQTEVEAELTRVRNLFLLTLPLALFAVGLGGWIVAGRALSPLKTIADTAELVTARGLDQRIPESCDSPEASRVIQVLNRMMDRLQQSFLQAIRFGADASHELKTPLAVMQGELENALQAAAPGSGEQQLFSNLLEETQRLKTITRSLLLLAQADAGQLRLSVEPLDFSAQLEAMMEDARVLAAEQRLRLMVQIPPGVKREADPALWHTAIFNLIANAIKYNEPGGEMTVRLEEQAGSVVFTVGNAGPGIPLTEQPRIFERFYRAAQTGTVRVEGIGLGLSLAREIIRAHGGELSLKESHPGWTSFVVTLNCKPFE